MPRKKASLVPIERIERSILVLRHQKVILDEDLAAIYGVTTARLNQQVRRNQDRCSLMTFRFSLPIKSLQS